jgi:hypothetical protein
MHYLHFLTCQSVTIFSKSFLLQDHGNKLPIFIKGQLMNYWFLDVVHHLIFPNRLYCIRNWTCFCPQVKRWGDAHDTHSGLVERPNLNHWNICTILNIRQPIKSRNPVILSVRDYHQILLEMIANQLQKLM